MLKTYFISLNLFHNFFSLTEYQCEYRTTDGSNVFYDLKPLCLGQTPYVYTPAGDDKTYVFQICGNANVDCIPNYPIEYQRGTAVQFFGSPATGSCTAKNGSVVPCTQDCEVLGEGPPIISLIDPRYRYEGVNITHYGVPSLNGDPFMCPPDFVHGGILSRQVTIQIACDDSVDGLNIINAYEESTCKYVIQTTSKYGCGCVPYCSNRNCGSDSCNGYCGPSGAMGNCPTGSTCSTTGQCCTPDCRGRTCGSDGCGGTCGSCVLGQICSKYQTCMPEYISPSPVPPPTIVYISTTTGPDIFASFLAGSFSVAAAAVGFAFYRAYQQKVNGA
jgi:hypothetical protein